MNAYSNTTPQQKPRERDHRFLVIVLILMGISAYLIYSDSRSVREREAYRTQVITEITNAQKEQMKEYDARNTRKIDSLLNRIATLDETLQAVAGNYDPQVTKELRMRYNKPVVLSKTDTLVNTGVYHKLQQQAQVASEALVQLDSCERNRMEIMEIQHNTVLTLQKGITDLGYSLADRPVVPPVIIDNTKKPRFGFVHGVVVGALVEIGVQLLLR